MPTNRRNTNNIPQTLARFQLVDKGTHFDRFRPGAKNEHDFFHRDSGFRIQDSGFSGQEQGTRSKNSEQ